jgi:lipid-binding SYLF domain-containing protein
MIESVSYFCIIKTVPTSINVNNYLRDGAGRIFVFGSIDFIKNNNNQTLKSCNMKKSKVMGMAGFLLVFMALLLYSPVMAQDSKESKIINDSHEARAEFIKSDGLMQSLFENSYGYVIFPNVGKGAVGVGGAAGNGTVYERGKVIGSAKLKQLSVGLQLGGQAYREVIFFENKEALDRFKADNFEFAAQASAVAVTSGASANVKYRNGVMVFTQEKGGLMYEASVGGQKFDYNAF